MGGAAGLCLCDAPRWRIWYDRSSFPLGRDRDCCFRAHAGVFIAAAVRLRLPASILIVGLFALCHGYAHGAEMPATASALGYAGGFALTTALFHVAGIGLGVGLEKIASAKFVRFAGGTIGLCGIGHGLAEAFYDCTCANPTLEVKMQVGGPFFVLLLLLQRSEKRE